ncbi:hypothetical protein CAP48_05560 [Advenella sp. S44]|uniref:glycosyltransferase family 2 protein n=1 Tax=Advenella sp. S44 TaxID=1982755 RepID=UPI000C29970F|nr:glycosyltransferase family 2 protein [Advenella sp. S44]PJX25512.1 hypothetical protein CAP48_05560 [Advenella sp. S44]
MDNAQISIILPTYNSERFISTAIESVLGQTYPDWELVVVDDGSTDQTRFIIESYARRDARIVFIRNSRNSGVAYSRNIGLQYAKGEYIAFIDSDDAWKSQKLAIQYEFMQSSSVQFSYTAYERLKNGRRLNTVVPPEFINYKGLLGGNCIGLSTTLLRRAVIGDATFIKAGHEDYIFWLTILEKSGVEARCVPPTIQPWVSYSIHENSLSADKARAMMWQWRIYRQILGFGFFKSAYYFCTYALRAIAKRM